MNFKEILKEIMVKKEFHHFNRFIETDQRISGMVFNQKEINFIKIIQNIPDFEDRIQHEIEFYTKIRPNSQFNKFKTPFLVDYSNDFHGYSYILYNFVQEAENIIYKEEDVYYSVIIDILNEIHNVQCKTNLPEHQNETEIKKILTLFDELKDHLKDFVQYRDIYNEISTEIKFKDLKIGFTHNDLNGNNILVRNNDIYVIDWERWRIWPIIYDISRTIYFASLYKSINSKALSLPFDSKIFQHYYSSLNYNEKQTIITHLIKTAAHMLEYKYPKYQNLPNNKEFRHYNLEFLKFLFNNLNSFK